jgi:hypothetical protein
MKVVALVAVAIIAVLIVGIAVFLGNNAINPPINSAPAPIIDVKITSFNYTGDSLSTSHGIAFRWFLLNYTNFGTVDVENLTITFNTGRTIENNRQLIHTNSTPPYNHIAEFTRGEPYPLGGIKTNETRDLTFYWPVGLIDYPHEFNFTATLKSNDTILDQAAIMIPIENRSIIG